MKADLSKCYVCLDPLATISQTGQCTCPNNQLLESDGYCPGSIRVSSRGAPKFKPSSGLSTGAIVGIVIGCLVFILLIVVGIVVWKKRFPKKEDSSPRVKKKSAL